MSRVLDNFEGFCCFLTTLFPKALTSGLYIYGLYGLIFKISIPLIGGWKGFVIGLIGTLIFTQSIYTYFKVIFIGPGSPLDFPDLRIDEGDLENLNSVDPPSFLSKNSITIKQNGKFRSCSKCSAWKPDRTHHCSSCAKCHLKMDHHCPWFACCIGFKNHKFFIQFLILTIIYTSYLLVVSGYQIWYFFHNDTYLDEYISLHLIALGVLSFCLSISVAVFTGVTLYFLLKNMTTIEFYDFSRYRANMEIINDSYYRYSNEPTAEKFGNPFDLGWKENWKQVMGQNLKEWVLPIVNQVETDEDFKNQGLYYQTDPVVYARLKSNSNLQNRLLQELNAVRTTIPHPNS